MIASLHLPAAAPKAAEIADLEFRLTAPSAEAMTREPRPPSALRGRITSFALAEPPAVRAEARGRRLFLAGGVHKDGKSLHARAIDRQPIPLPGDAEMSDQFTVSGMSGANWLNLLAPGFWREYCVDTQKKI